MSADWYYISTQCPGNDNNFNTCVLNCLGDSTVVTGCGSLLERSGDWCETSAGDYCCDSNCCTVKPGVIAAAVIVPVVLIASGIACCCFCCVGCPGYQSRMNKTNFGATGNSAAPVSAVQMANTYDQPVAKANYS